MSLSSVKVGETADELFGISRSKKLKGFIWSAGVIFALAGAAKVFSALGSGYWLNIPDPIFGISNRTLIVSVGIAELVVSLLALTSDKFHLCLYSTASLATGLVVYRIGLWVVGSDQPCGCLGELAGVFGISPAVAENVMGITALYLTFGSYFAIFREARVARFRTVASVTIVGLNLLAMPMAMGSTEDLGPLVRPVFSIEGTATALANQGGVDRVVGFHVTVSNHLWQIKLEAFDKSSVFKQYNTGGDGKWIYSVASDWNGGMLAEMSESKIPRLGGNDILAALWSVYAVECVVTNRTFLEILNPFSNRLPRPSVEVSWQSQPDGNGVRGFEFNPLPEGGRSGGKSLSERQNRPNPNLRCVFLHAVPTTAGYFIPTQSELRCFLVDSNQNEIVINGYRLEATNIVVDSVEMPKLPDMPVDKILTLLDARDENYGNPLAIGKFEAAGVWPTKSDVQRYPEYLAWSRMVYPPRVNKMLIMSGFALAMLLPVLIWGIKQRNNKQR